MYSDGVILFISKNKYSIFLRKERFLTLSVGKQHLPCRYYSQIKRYDVRHFPFTNFPYLTDSYKKTLHRNLN